MPLIETDDNDPLQGLPPRERFLRAKAEHFIRRADECIRMSRFSAARKYLSRAAENDPASSWRKDLETAIDDKFFEIEHRGNGVGHDGSVQPLRRRRSELVLLVDQDEQLLENLGGALYRYGFQVLGAINYEEAVEAMSSVVPDVVISEVNFENGARGFDLYQWIKNNLPNQSIPFLFLAARIDRETLIAGKRFGVDDFLHKPVDEEVVTASIVNCVARRRTTAIPA